MAGLFVGRLVVSAAGVIGALQCLRVPDAAVVPAANAERGVLAAALVLSVLVASACVAHRSVITAGMSGACPQDMGAPARHLALLGSVLSSASLILLCASVLVMGPWHTVLPERVTGRPVEIAALVGAVWLMAASLVSSAGASLWSKASASRRWFAWVSGVAASIILLVPAPYTIAWNRSETSGALLSASGIALALLCVRQAEVQRAKMHGDGAPS
ncbi:MAG: hypothetical protein FJX72_15120 [Armatimonadetes bacterium]|nr:hypothetical protein [Armatimonadota bacterium]